MNLSTDKPEVFSERLRERLFALNLRQSDLVRSLGVSATTVSTWLSGRNFARPELMRKLADELNTTTAYLYGDTWKPERIHDKSGEVHWRDKAKGKCEEIKLHPKIDSLAQQLMDCEGFTSKQELFTWLVKEEATRQQIPEPEEIDFSGKDSDPALESFVQAHELSHWAEQGKLVINKKTGRYQTADGKPFSEHFDVHLHPKPPHDPSGEVTVKKDGKIVREAKKG